MKGGYNMYSLIENFNYCKRVLSNLNIPYSGRVNIVVNTRSKKRWGRTTRHTATNDYTIQVNVDLLDERNDVYGLRNTIIHELLHTCDGCMNHGNKWSYYANIVSRETEYRIVRTSTAEEKKVTYTRNNTPNYKYIIKCPKCEHSWKYQRASKAVKMADKCICPYCNTTGLSVYSI